MQTIIVEDELAGQEILKNKILDVAPHCSIKATIDNKDDAVSYLKNNPIDIVFLDAQIKGGTGIELIQELLTYQEGLPPTNNTFSMPEIIFITAHQEYALDALNLDATYYLLKPIYSEKLQKAIEIASKHIQQRREKTKLNDSLLVNYKNEYINVPVQDVFYLQGEGAYTTIFLSDTSFLVSKNIGYYQKLLPQTLFFRNHHSFIVNLTHIKKVYKNRGGILLLKNGAEIPVAQRKMSYFLLKFNIA